MLKHPELLNKTAVLSDKKRKNLLKSAQSTKADVESCYEITPNSKAKFQSHHNTPSKFRLDSKIDPKKPIFLDIFISDPKQKKSMTTKNKSSRRNMDYIKVRISFTVRISKIKDLFCLKLRTIVEEILHVISLIQVGNHQKTRQTLKCKRDVRL